MKKNLQSGMVYYAVTAAIMIPFGIKMAFFGLLFAASYLFNLRLVNYAGFPEVNAKNKRNLVIAAAVIVLLLSAFLRELVSFGWDQFAIAMVVGSFFFSHETFRRVLFFAALAGFEVRLLQTGVSIPETALFFGALFFHRFCATNDALGLNLRETWGPVDRRTFFGWAGLFVLIAVLLGAWGRWEDGQIKIAIAAHEQARPVHVNSAQKPAPSIPLPRLIAAVVIGFLIWHGARRYLARDSKDDKEKEIMRVLSQQGFIEELPPEQRAVFHLPSGNRGRVLKSYEVLLCLAEKKLKRSLRSGTPAERQVHLESAFGSFGISWDDITRVFYAARYGDRDVTDEDLDLFRRNCDSVDDLVLSDSRGVVR